MKLIDFYVHDSLLDGCKEAGTAACLRNYPYQVSFSQFNRVSRTHTHTHKEERRFPGEQDPDSSSVEAN